MPTGSQYQLQKSRKGGGTDGRSGGGLKLDHDPPTNRSSQSRCPTDNPLGRGKSDDQKEPISANGSVSAGLVPQKFEEKGSENVDSGYCFDAEADFPELKDANPCPEPEPEDLPPPLPDGFVEERVQVNRRKLEHMIQGRTEVYGGRRVNAEEFFDMVAAATNTEVSWPTRLKIGAKTKKDPHVKLVGLPEHVREARLTIAQMLERKQNRVTLKMDVSYADHSHIIGKQGRNTQNVMRDTGCHIHFPDSNRSPDLPKSNQVSVAGPMDKVEKARAAIRGLAPIALSMDFSSQSHAVSGFEEQVFFEIGTKFELTIMVRENQMTGVPFVIVKGNTYQERDIVCAVNEMAQRLASTLNPKVAMGMEVLAPQRATVCGEDGKNVAAISDYSGAQILFPHANGLDASTFYIQGTVESVLRARKFLTGLLPVFMVFDLPNQSPVPSAQVLSEIESEFKVALSVRPKHGADRFTVNVRSDERFLSKVYAVRQRLCPDNDTPVVCNDYMFMANFNFNPPPGGWGGSRYASNSSSPALDQRSSFAHHNGSPAGGKGVSGWVPYQFAQPPLNVASPHQLMMTANGKPPVQYYQATGGSSGAIALQNGPSIPQNGGPMRSPVASPLMAVNNNNFSVNTAGSFLSPISPIPQTIPHFYPTPTTMDESHAQHYNAITSGKRGNQNNSHGDGSRHSSANSNSALSYGGSRDQEYGCSGGSPRHLGGGSDSGEPDQNGTGSPPAPGSVHIGSSHSAGNSPVKTVIMTTQQHLQFQQQQFLQQNSNSFASAQQQQRYVFGNGSTHSSPRHQPLGHRNSVNSDYGGIGGPCSARDALPGGTQQERRASSVTPTPVSTSSGASGNSVAGAKLTAKVVPEIRKDPSPPNLRKNIPPPLPPLSSSNLQQQNCNSISNTLHPKASIGASSGYGSSRSSSMSSSGAGSLGRPNTIGLLEQPADQITPCSPGPMTPLAGKGFPALTENPPPMIQPSLQHDPDPRAAPLASGILQSAFRLQNEKEEHSAWKVVGNRGDADRQLTAYQEMAIRASKAMAEHPCGPRVPNNLYSGFGLSLTAPAAVLQAQFAAMRSIGAATNETIEELESQDDSEDDSSSYYGGGAHHDPNNNKQRIDLNCTAYFDSLKPKTAGFEFNPDTDDLSLLLTIFNLTRYEEVFRKEEIDLKLLLEMSEEDLKEIGLVFSHRRKLSLAIQKIKKERAMGAKSIFLG